MPAAPASGVVFGGVSCAVECGSTGVLAPSESPLGQVSTSLPLAPQERKRNVIHPHPLAGRTVPYAFHDEEQPWSGEDLNAVRAERRAPL